MTDVSETAKKLRRAAAQQARYHAERDELIRQARAEGMGVREIARLVGMSHPGVLAILTRERDPAGLDGLVAAEERATGDRPPRPFYDRVVMAGHER